MRVIPGRIWVISDTHLLSAENLPDSFVKLVGREDLDIHLGDFTSPCVAGFLESIAALEGVCGNCDSRSIRDSFPVSKTMDMNGYRISMTHGRGSPSETLRRVKTHFEGRVDVALFGHTHSACQVREGGTLFVNPGSLTDGRGTIESFALLHLDSEPSVEFFTL